MVYEPLHHKYRPKTFAQLVGQEAIATTLSGAIATAKIAPAYLFTGPRGTGKTSSARILAKSLNCLSSSHPTVNPCGECDVCRAIETNSALDVIEIDAASHTGVDNIRTLIERSQFAPVQCRYKIYVVDECHMLSVAAFNALLKTLEEPPARVVFILATTDPQRVLPTIISRCQRFDFRRIRIESMRAHLTTIAEAEGIAIAPSALEVVANMANGGLRDAESLLDQLSLLPQPITIEQVWELVGAIPEQDLLQLLEAIANRQLAAVVEQVRHLLDRGREPIIVLQSLTGFYRDLLLAKTTPQRADLVALRPATWQQLCQLAQSYSWSNIVAAQQLLQQAQTGLRQTTQPRLWLEMTLLGMATASLNDSHIDFSESNRVTTPAHNSEIPASKSLKQAVSTSGAATTNVSASSRPQNVDQPATSPTKPIDVVVASKSAAAQSQTQKQTTTSTKPLSVKASSQAEVSTPTELSSRNSLQLEVLWQKVLDSLQPGIRGMLKQGSLQEFTGELAIITINNKAVMTILQPQIAEVEAAFGRYAGQTVRVRLILSPNSSQIGDRPLGAGRANRQTVPTSSSKIDSPTLKSSPSETTKKVESGDRFDKSTAPPKSLDSKTIEPSQSIATTKIQVASDNIADDSVDLQTATDKLVKMFDAEVVNLDFTDEAESDSITQIQTSTTEENKTTLKNRPSIESYLNEADF